MSWRPTYSTISSSQYLNDIVHTHVEMLFRRELNQMNISKKEDQAKQLQKYLYIIKNYEKIEENDSNKNFFDAIKETSLFQTLAAIMNKDGKSVNNLLFKQSGGINFEKQMQNLAVALTKVCTKDLNLTQESFSFGQTKTLVDVEKFMSKEAQSLMKQMGVNTQKYINQEAKKAATKNKNQEGLLYYLPAVDIKIDQGIVNQINISVEIESKFPQLYEFATLFLNSSFTLKNYSKKKSAIELGRTNLFRIFSDYLPTLDLEPFKTTDGLISFINALQNRKKGNVKEKKIADSKIEQHYMHIRNVYELTGTGQQYSRQDPTVNELKNYISQGVDFLIWNEHNSDKIYVASTLGILANYFELNTGFYGRSRAYLSKNSVQ